MGSIGDTFTPTVPAVGASGTGYATSVNAVLTELITRVSSPVPLSALSGSTLDLNNVPAIDFQYLGLYEQLAVPGASPVGRLERFENNLYWVGLSGAVKITNGANLNASGIGGIGGDYGGVNPALVSFVDAANRYDFYDDAAGLLWAHLRGRSIYIGGTAGSINFAQITFGGGSNYTLTLPAALPALDFQMLTVDETGAIATDGVLNNDITLASTTKIKHGDRTRLYSVKTGYGAGTKFIATSGSSLPNDVGVQYQTAGAGSAVQEEPITMQIGERLKSVAFRLNKTGTTITTIRVYKYSVATGTGTLLATGTSTSSGRQSITCTLGAPETIATDEAIWVTWAPGDNLEFAGTIEATYDVV